ncbi:Uncharacterised protein [Mycobacteroides abscessus subsp. abscessus]|nr:Uncharacterised protein [Mycobacteroides abscessus subsp. abscessus]SIC79332.1 Uncharacterised protein [Mycobacteroides abscessus subsp. abscessus]SKK32998.1 Uncharacterised protein [Mycobacteroides abscessus subsp. abscessus]SKP26687.1 Uncharacterised protein [Mycobacteroides abscessus subsp. abscessus]
MWVIVWWRDLQASGVLGARNPLALRGRWKMFRITRCDRRVMEEIVLRVRGYLFDQGIDTKFERAPKPAVRGLNRHRNSRPKITWSSEKYSVEFQIDFMNAWYIGHAVYSHDGVGLRGGSFGFTVAREVSDLREVAAAFAAAVADPKVKWIVGEGPTSDRVEWMVGNAD